MKDIVNLGAKLLLITLVAALSLGFINQITIDKIHEQRALANQRAREAVFSSADGFEEVSYDGNANVQETFEAKSEGSTVGYVFKVASKGYGGPIEVIVGIDIEGQVTGVRVGKHNETPGLGAKANEKAFYSQYAGMNATGNIGVSKTSSSDTEIQAISGATITSSAVTRAVNDASQAFEALAN